MNATVKQLDQHLKFLQDEVAYLRKTHARVPWAEAKIVKLDAIAEVLRQVRQEKQMTTVGGARIDETGGN